ncbi:hypothetical protein PsorP6_013769 [Peronosclerospora sorghi]|uniref:Uncharacterized protein n=1 Tax=Peronosclerospora sorghi TaxID=230839 RepID=A0ACC0VHR2_9STRA|nr:hypothetical protein PsorP6_013769 [Peronosclerospora sorghi]
MTDYKEEQAMEVEALEAIYMDDFVRLGWNSTVALLLQAEIPETYPNVAPKVCIASSLSITTDIGLLTTGLCNDCQLDVIVKKGLAESQVKEIKQLLAQQVNENMGMAMMYTLSEAVREYIVENNREGNDGSEHQEMLRRMEQKKRKEEKVEADKIEQDNADNEEKRREFHGRQLWTTGMVTEDGAEEAEAEAEGIDAAEQEENERQN